MNYIGKWVVVRRYPNGQNSYIGRLQCLHIKEQTKNTVFGSESVDFSWRHKYMINEIVRVVTEDEVRSILTNQRVTRNNYTNSLCKLQEEYSSALQDIAEGNREEPFNSLEPEPKSMLIQARCPKDDTLGELQSMTVVRDTVFNDAMGVRIKWVCQECFDLFETQIPYLEIKKIG